MGLDLEDFNSIVSSLSLDASEKHYSAEFSEKSR